MKTYLRIITKDDKKFDVCVTDFSVDPCGGFFIISNGIFDPPHLFDLNKFLSIRIIDKSRAGVDYKCYNSINLCISENNLEEFV